MPVESWFPVPIYVADIDGADELNAAMLPILRAHSRDRTTHQPLVNGAAYSGSNAADSAQYLQRISALAPLYRAIHAHASRFARDLELDLKNEHLYLGRSWVNILGKGGHIDRHNHMAALFSGAYYLQVPDEDTVLRFTDPKELIRRDPLYSTRRTPFNTSYVDFPVKAGRIVLFPGWLSHGMPRPHSSKQERVSVAMDYFSIALSGQSPPPPPVGLVEKLWRELDNKTDG